MFSTDKNISKKYNEKGNDVIAYFRELRICFAKNTTTQYLTLLSLKNMIISTAFPLFLFLLGILIN